MNIGSRLQVAGCWVGPNGQLFAFNVDSNKSRPLCHVFRSRKAFMNMRNRGISIMKSYKDLEIYQLSESLAIEIHFLSLALPKFELYEEGSQVRRSSKGVTSAIVEGYGRRRYVADFVRYLTYAIAECDETIQHLRFLVKTKSLADEGLGNRLLTNYAVLSKKINTYTTWVERDMEVPAKPTRKTKLNTEHRGANLADNPSDQQPVTSNISSR
jgi:four helix bundle protein